MDSFACVGISRVKGMGSIFMFLLTLVLTLTLLLSSLPTQQPLWRWPQVSLGDFGIGYGMGSAAGVHVVAAV